MIEIVYYTLSNFHFKYRFISINFAAYNQLFK